MKQTDSWKRIFLAAAVPIAAALLFTGCSSTESETAAGTDTGSASLPASETGDDRKADDGREADDGNEGKDNREVNDGRDADNDQENTTATQVTGPYGTLSVELPDGWVSQPYESGSEHSNSGSYGMWLHPAEEENGYIDLCYMQTFGVCGTGLQQETITLAGDEASVGIYDNHTMWDFVSFRGVNEGITAQNVMAGEWPEAYRKKTMDILDTLRFDPDRAKGAVSYFRRDSEIPQIGLMAEAHDITATGAVIRFRVWDPELATGDLEYGEDYTLEQQEGDEWKEVPTVFEGEWAVNAIAYLIPKEPESTGSEWKVNWEWLYGRLEPGDYRIGKTVDDFRETGSYDSYRIYVYFHYAGD